MFYWSVQHGVVVCVLTRCYLDLSALPRRHSLRSCAGRPVRTVFLRGGRPLISGRLDVALRGASSADAEDTRAARRRHGGFPQVQPVPLRFASPSCGASRADVLVPTPEHVRFSAILPRRHETRRWSEVDPESSLVSLRLEGRTACRSTTRASWRRASTTWTTSAESGGWTPSSTPWG